MSVEKEQGKKNAEDAVMDSLKEATEVAGALVNPVLKTTAQMLDRRLLYQSPFYRKLRMYLR